MTADERIQLISWVEELMTDTIEASAFQKLEARLASSSEARELYLSHTSIDPMLRWVMESPAEEPEQPTIVRPNFGVGRTAFAMAAAVVVLAAISIALLMPDPPLREPISLTLANDVRVELSADAEFSKATTESDFDLRSGTGTFFVGENGRGFTVVLPHGKIIDLGTAFSVDIDAEGSAMIRVLSGAIEVYSGDSVYPLEAGASGWLSSTGWDSAIDTPPTETSAYDRLVDASSPVTRWSFTGTEGAWLAGLGSVKLAAGPRPPEFQAFADTNTAGFFGGAGSIRTPDRADGSAFDFENGDEITLEAWVKVGVVHDNQNVYIVGKGRTKNLGFTADNQNFSLRLRGQNGASCISFLFRSDPEGALTGRREEDERFFHRWTADTGITNGDRWHHVAVTYRYGDPNTIRGYLNGESLAGAWDMGGATSTSPIVDDDEIWIGSSMGGSSSNTFPGAIDEVAIYREQLSPETIRKHASIFAAGK